MAFDQPGWLIAQPDDLSDIDIWMSMSIINTQITKKYCTECANNGDKW